MKNPKIAEAAMALAQTLVEAELENEAPLFLTTTTDADGHTIIVSGNTRGLLQMASILVALAQNAADGQNFHFNEDNTLSDPSHDLIMMFQKAPQPVSAGRNASPEPVSATPFSHKRAEPRLVYPPQG